MLGSPSQLSSRFEVPLHLELEDGEHVRSLDVAQVLVSLFRGLAPLVGMPARTATPSSNLRVDARVQNTPGRLAIERGGKRVEDPVHEVGGLGVRFHTSKSITEGFPPAA